MKQPIVEFNNFSFRYESQVENTLKNINLKIYPNEKVLILGPSGSGKSTLSYCLNGLIPHSFLGEIRGECIIHGQLIQESSILSQSKKIGTVLQDSDLQFVGLSVGEDIAFSMENYNIPREKMLNDVKQYAHQVGMDSFLKHIPFSLSGGQKQKVSIAGVLNENVDLLLFDEPLASLDPQMGKKAIELIDTLNTTTGATIVIIEHRLEDVLQAPIDRIILMNDGEIIADKTPNELLKSGLLETYGIREPLYLSALKHVSNEILEQDDLDDLDALNVASYRDLIIDELEKESQKPIVSNTEVLIETKQLSFDYDTFTALRDVSITINHGDKIALIGENGAGKTTLAKLLCGALRPTYGFIAYKNEDYLKYSIKELANFIGYVMQNPNQMLVKDTVLKEARLALELRNVSETEIVNRVEEVLKITGLYSLRNWPIDSLSYGQKKRVTIASILVLRPECLILDEPTAGQDYRHYREVLDFVNALNEEYNLTLIFITHDMHLAMEYTQRAIVLSKGEVIADDKTEVILSNTRILNEASLKETSISKLAYKLDINPVSLIKYFVEKEKEHVHE